MIVNENITELAYDLEKLDMKSNNSQSKNDVEQLDKTNEATDHGINKTTDYGSNEANEPLNEISK